MYVCMPKASPISGKLCWVSSFASAIATWRGLAMLRLRRLLWRSEILILKYSATVRWILSTLTCLSCRASRSFSFARTVRTGPNFCCPLGVPSWILGNLCNSCPLPSYCASICFHSCPYSVFWAITFFSLKEGVEEERGYCSFFWNVKIKRVGPFYYKKDCFIIKTNKNALFMKRGRLLIKKKPLPGMPRSAAHKLDTPQPFPNQSPTMSYIF